MAKDEYVTCKERGARRKLINTARGMEWIATQNNEEITVKRKNRIINVEEKWYVWSEKRNDIKEENKREDEEEKVEDRKKVNEEFI